MFDVVTFWFSKNGVGNLKEMRQKVAHKAAGDKARKY